MNISDLTNTMIETKEDVASLKTDISYIKEDVSMIIQKLDETLNGFHSRDARCAVHESRTKYIDSKLKTYIKVYGPILTFLSSLFGGLIVYIVTTHIR